MLNVAEHRWSRVPDDAPSDVPETYVYPGQVLDTADGTLASTILGTCVSVCLFDPVAGIGGMNHFLLPSARLPGSQPNRFGELATTYLLERVLARGASRDRLQAKVFGGMQGRIGAGGPSDELGSRNAAIAFDVLRAADIRVVSHDVGGSKSRKVLFHTRDGRAWVRHF